MSATSFVDIVSKLNTATGAKLTVANYIDWLEGGKTFNKFDKAVRQFLGKDLYAAGYATARTEIVLWVKLGVKMPASAETCLARAIIKNPAKYLSGFAG